MNDSIGRTVIGSRKILVVEDTQSVADFIREMLQTFGHQAEIALSVQQALDTFTSGKYDLIITDYTMPGMNGIEFARQVKQRAPEQLILLITGSTFSLGETAAVQMPVEAVLQKPFSVMEFQDMLNGLFEMRRVPSSAGDSVQDRSHDQKYSATRNSQSPTQGSFRGFDGRAPA